ncbi:MAG: Flagellar protein FliT [Candidatus Erwinia impunctatus]|nr:Flagellar protein FliT [Culicoides impunctatus]
MTISPHLLELYQHIVTLSQTMLRLASEERWDELIVMEVDHVTAVEKIADETEQTPLPPEAMAKLRPVLRHILDNEAEVRNLLQIRKDKLSSLINQATKQKNVNTAYGQLAGVVLFPKE